MCTINIIATSYDFQLQRNFLQSIELKKITGKIPWSDIKDTQLHLSISTIFERQTESHVIGSTIDHIFDDKRNKRSVCTQLDACVGRWNALDLVGRQARK